MNEQELTALVEKVVREAKGEKKSCACAHKITLDRARRLTDVIQERAREMGVKAVVAVADNGGNPVSVQSMDGAYLASWEIALQKSYTAVAMKMSTAKLAELAAPGNSLYGIQFLDLGRGVSGGKLVMFGGGEPLEYSGKVVGGLGVSGGTAEQDTELAEFGKLKFKEISE